MIVGYARTSTVDQQAGLDAQVRDLKAAGCERVFCEQVSSIAEREQLDAALDFIREGDLFTVTKLDRLARSMSNLMDIQATIERKKASLRILAMNLDTTTPTGKLMMNVMGSVAQFEREMMLERQREGVEKAKSEGKYRGRKPTAMMRASDVLTLHSQNNSINQIVEKTGISRSSIVRIIRTKRARDAIF